MKPLSQKEIASMQVPDELSKFVVLQRKPELNKPALRKISGLCVDYSYRKEIAPKLLFDARVFCSPTSLRTNVAGLAFILEHGFDAFKSIAQADAAGTISSEAAKYLGLHPIQARDLFYPKYAREQTWETAYLACNHLWATGTVVWVNPSWNGCA